MRNQMKAVSFHRRACSFSAGLATLFASSTALADPPTWTCTNGPPPPGRGAQSMGFDARRHVCLMFGGSNNSDPPFADTWAWNGTIWQLAATTGPSGRSNSGMAYDHASGRMILYGGNRLGTDLGDTWAWDGTSWQDVSPAIGPGPRGSPVLVADPDRARIVLWGGARAGQCGPGDCRDTWEWDGASWTQVATMGPPPRQSFAMAYVGGGKILLFGGLDAAVQPLGDAWIYDGAAMPSTWTPWSGSPSPVARGGHVMMWESHTNRVLLFGGDDGNTVFYNDTWEFEDGRWRLVLVTSSPQARSNFAGAFDSKRHIAVFFGGKLSNSTYDTSQTCELTPTPFCYPDCDGSVTSPLLNINDFTCFLNRFANGCT